MPVRKPILPAPPVVEWKQKLGYLRSQIQLKIKDEELTLLCGFMAIVGLPGEEDSRRFFYAIKGLLLQQGRESRLPKVLRLLPPDRKKLLRFADVAKAYGDIVGPLSDGKIQVDRVVKVMLEIPDGRPYIQRLYNTGFYHLGAIFHPNTLERARRDMRGLFSGSEGEDGYWERTSDQLNIVDE